MDKTEVSNAEISKREKLRKAIEEQLPERYKLAKGDYFAMPNEEQSMHVLKEQCSWCENVNICDIKNNLVRELGGTTGTRDYALVTLVDVDTEEEQVYCTESRDTSLGIDYDISKKTEFLKRRLDNKPNCLDDYRFLARFFGLT